VDGLSLGRRIRVYELDHGFSRLWVESFIRNKQRRARRQQPVNPDYEVRWQFEPGNRHWIDLRSLLPHVPGHANS
jgi:hypothetical protein